MLKTTASRPAAVFMAMITALALLTGAIAVPILCRPFYYAHIGPLELEASTGLTQGEIQTAFDQMLDYCQGRTDTFSTGVLPWSESGRSHFADVRVLFQLDLQALVLSLGMLAGLGCLVWRGRLRPARLLGRGFSFWAGAGLAAVFLLVGSLAALDFDRAFTLFHALFFPGRDNWLFDPAQDQIIRILPQVHFRNCALLILALLLLGCAALIAADLLWAKRQAQQRKKLVQNS